jgi:hypothetical protein
MELQQAIKEVKKAVKDMRLQSGKSVFDEWLILSINYQRFDILHHNKPIFLKNSAGFDINIHMLVDEIQKSSYVPGQYFFSMEAPGTLYDAFIVAGPEKYIIFNNTIQSMTEISTDPLWLSCQSRFVELSEMFRQDSLN